MSKKDSHKVIDVLKDKIYYSFGEKQRLYIIRELMKDSEILILDEYTSALYYITIGKNIVQYAGKEMLEKGADSFYVTVYNPAKIFWENCGYVNTEKIAFNGLQIYKKAK